MADNTERVYRREETEKLVPQQVKRLNVGADCVGK